ncbi:lysophosphatidylserine lipase ABHD12 isoform X1 [Schistocerca americana]|uniref:lysophosphatidylserine lipase ABHD12 isoform X1 n=1 Tax=Schistocerca americana TaxID=7009 RepID=UPI001F4FC4FE|nr:lysophosphatidylserine lipase ABHD12 isoform X1 [Schistocerca americana]XP_046989450.1 lysophosphatidylserine lipase ABHD12 isoform X1 [Schistocerca americana]XP_047107657.1 lysophosphatidylserine lipase ABHD12 isoform X1 [Schistocerca piceifrons]XP_047107658.1 lysophosphatidylserine lipase ABHD12 isoform X1 [Schistocerca piceifrons]XP_049775179.1 lysophosphatidylserine lipase ABHD12 isoform X1 [Schistocerca cancellata]XP_049775180.1 lysophosphatidylserine lipase ABHD12 isoform X1 [Schistoc
MVGITVTISLFLLPVGLWLQGIIVLTTLKIFLAVLLFIYIVVPFVFRYTYALQRTMIFLNFVRWPRNPDFNVPKKYGLDGTRNFYVKTTEDVQLGVWHTLPKSLINESKTADDEFFEKSLTRGEPIILYMHGNSGSRASPHRVELYKMLRNLNYHVISFDYRSYADSSPVSPSETGVVSDGKFMYRWVEEHAKGSPLFVWGHSLGTGVSSHVLDLLAQEGKSPSGLILESPFNNLRDEIKEHPFARLFNQLPWFDFFFIDPIEQNDLLFASDKHLVNVHCPILILHAQDDVVVPFILGQRLYKSLEQTRPKDAASVEFVIFEDKYRYGHKYICRAPELPDIIQKFLGSILKS